MNIQLSIPLVVALDDPAATLELVGGKGASLARWRGRLARARLAFTSPPPHIAALWPRTACKRDSGRRWPALLADQPGHT